jgi:hypothetical protein
MNSTPAPKAPEGGDASGAPADEGLAHAYKQIVRADQQLARLSEQVARMERDAARTPSAGPDPQSPPARPPTRTLVSLPWAACIVVAALVLLSSYGGAKLVVARWPSQPVSAQSSPLDNPPSPAEPASPAVKLAAAEPAPPPAQAMPPEATPSKTTLVAQIAPQDVAATATAATADPTQLLQTMARDLANLQRSIEQLNATQQQLAKAAGDNSKDIADLRASQEEMKRVLAKVSEQNPSRTSPPPAPPASVLRKPERTVQPQRPRPRPWIPRQEWYYDDW